MDPRAHLGLASARREGGVVGVLSAVRFVERRSVRRAGGAEWFAFVGKAGGSGRAPVHRYGFPAQETELRGGESLHRTGGEKLGTVERISLDERVIEIKKRGDSANVHPDAVFAHNVINTAVLAEGLMRIGQRVADQGIAGDGQYGAARSLLLRESPRLNGEPLYVPGETMLAAAMRIAPKFQGGVLPIQGPPGTGKTHVGARSMIAGLAGSGRKIGITATSHKVIRRLLDEVVAAGEELGVSLRGIHKPSDGENADSITCTDSNEEVFAALASGRQVAAGTAWLWARPEAFESVDVLFVDEAAQMSLANVLAVSVCSPKPGAVGGPAATRSADTGESSGGDQRLGVGLHFGGPADHRCGSRTFSRRYVAAPPKDLRLHVGNVL